MTCGLLPTNFAFILWLPLLKSDAQTFSVSSGVIKIGALALQFRNNRIFIALLHDDGLFGGTDRTVVEGLACHDIADSLFDVGCALDVCRELPAPPLPRAGFPALYAAFTIPGPPVAMIKFTSLHFISSLVAPIVGMVIQPMMSSEPPLPPPRPASVLPLSGYILPQTDEGKYDGIA